MIILETYRCWTCGGTFSYVRVTNPRSHCSELCVLEAKRKRERLAAQERRASQGKQVRLGSRGVNHWRLR